MNDSEISNFNRSFARSEPNLPRCRQINVTEYFDQTNHNHSLIRHYSFKELRGDSQDCSPFFTRDDFSLFFPNPNINSPQHYAIRENLDFKDDWNNEKTLNDLNCSPMDIDRSEDCADVSMKENSWYGKQLSIKSNNIEEKEDNLIKEEEVLIKNNITKEETVKAKKKFNKSARKMSLLQVLIVVLLGIVLARFLIIKNVSLNDFPLSDIENDLKTNIFNQNHVVDRLIFNLNRIHSSTKLIKVLVLVGSTGVGKTFILNRLKNHYPSDLLISLNYNLDKDILELNKNTSFPNKCFILSIDDLQMKNLSSIELFIKSLSDKCVFIIPIFNIQETSGDVNKLKHIIRYDYFQQIANYFVQNIPSSESLLLNAMNRKHLETWIKKVLGKRGLDVGKLDGFIKNLVDNHDVDNFGFKGIIPKINLLSS